jgi:hypothetical protein
MYLRFHLYLAILYKIISTSWFFGRLQLSPLPKVIIFFTLADILLTSLFVI